MEQIFGKGFSGIFQFCFFYYFSLGVLFLKKELDDFRDEDEDEDELLEEDFEDEELLFKRRLQKKILVKFLGKVMFVKQRGFKFIFKVLVVQWGKVRFLFKKVFFKVKIFVKKVRFLFIVIKKFSGGFLKKFVISVRKEVKLLGKGKFIMKKFFRVKK